MTTDLTFERVRSTNRVRAEKWHSGSLSNGWTGADWSNAMGGEVGEAADALLDLIDSLTSMVAFASKAGRLQDYIKKIRRKDINAPGAKDPDLETLLHNVAMECADVYLYLDLLCSYHGIDLASAVTEKFNEVSDREGFSEKL